jgi:MYXO-CTERM domain-containing protein
MTHHHLLQRLAVLAWFGCVAAPAGATTTSVSPYPTAYSEQVIDVDDFDYDSDWQPADSPIQVRLVIHAGNTITIDMLGDAIYDWSDGTVLLEGQPDMGSYAVDLGLSITSSLRFDLMGVEWEGEVGEPIEFLVEDWVAFEPYLLPGNPDSPLDVTTEVEKQTVVDYSALDLYVASASLQVAISGNLNTWFETTRVTLTRHGVDGGVAELLAWAEPQPLALEDVAPLDSAGATAQLEGDVVFTPDLHAWPTVVVEVFGTETTLAEFDIPIELPVVEASWIFDPADLLFERPEPPVDTGDTGAEDDMGDTTDTGDTSGVDKPGCGCSSGGGAGLAGLAWLLLGAAVLRRRRG